MKWQRSIGIEFDLNICMCVRVYMGTLGTLGEDNYKVGIGTVKEHRENPGLQGRGERPTRGVSGSKGNNVCLMVFPRPGPSFSFFSQASGSCHWILAKYH